MPAISIPETPPSTSSSSTECEDSASVLAKPKPGKQVRFKTSSSSAESANDIQFVVWPQEPRFVSCSTYSSSNTDSADLIQNAQPCKYSEQNDNLTTDDGNNEESPEILPETLPSQIPSKDYQLGQMVDKIGSRIEQLDRRSESEAPSLPSGIVTPEVISPRQELQSLVMAPGLPLFSGTERVLREEGNYEQWKFQVRGMCSSCPESTVQSALITSVRGEASSLVSFVGFNAPLSMILEAMEKRFGKVPTTDRHQQEFFQLQQDNGERVQHFASWLERTFKKLQEAFPRPVWGSAVERKTVP